MFTSLGYHTFAISQNLTQEEAGLLFEEFKKYRNSTNEICIMGTQKYEKDPLGRHCEIVYPGQYKGLAWKIRFSNRGFCIDGEYKPCSIKATINPKVLVGEKNYIVAADAGYLNDVKRIFDQEAGKISPKLRGFDQYSLNRIDYCINFDVSELRVCCPPELMKRLPEMIMTLIKCGDIPDHFVEEYSENGGWQFYLKSKSVVINCYWKHDDLRRNFIECKDLDKSYDIIRFEIQYKYPKVYSKSSGIKKKNKCQKSALEEKLDKQGFWNFAENQSTLAEGERKQLFEAYRSMIRMDKVVVIEAMLSDEKCRETIEDYFYKVVKRGDYYTFDEAQKIIESKVSGWEKITRLKNTIQTIYDYGGIAKVKAELKNKMAEEFRMSLRDLAKLGLNPVTIPKEWGIDHIPNLLDNYMILRTEEQNKIREKRENEQMLKDYIKDCKKKGISWI